MSVYVVGSGVALYVIDLLVLYNISFLYINIVEPNSSRGYESKKEAKVLLDSEIMLYCTGSNLKNN